VVVLAFAALVGSRVQQKKARAEALKQQVPPPTAVAVAAPRQGRMVDALNLTGNVVAQQEVQLVPKASGRLNSLWVQEGSPVVRGQQLGEIDHAELDAQILQAQASAQTAKANLAQMQNGPLKTQIAQARASVRQLEATLQQLQTSSAQTERDLQRQQALAAEGVITPQQLELSRTQLQSSKQQILAMEQQIVGARANLQQLLDGTRPEQIESARAQYHQALATIRLYQAQLQNYRLISPLTGIVTQKHVDPGNLVGSSGPVLSLAQNQRPEVEIFLPEREIEKVHTGQQVELRAAGFANQVFIAHLTQISPIVNPQTRLVKLTARLDSSRSLPSGMLVDCQIVLQEKQKTWVVPAESVIHEKTGDLVYTVKNKTVTAKPVKTGLRTPEEIEVLQGLVAADQVIVKGNSFVRPGDKVQVQAAVQEAQ